MAAISKTKNQPITVREMADGHYPRVFTWRGRDFEVVEIGGTWRLLGRWWEGDGERRFVRIITSTGACLDLCHYKSADLWQVHKVYD